jgi:multiple sugar transport system substrate-binding protein
MKRITSTILVLAMLLMIGLASAETYTTDFDVPATGKPLIIYSWNDEFQGMLKTYYIPAVGGTVEDDGTMVLPNGDKIEFVINPNDGGVYQQKLDAALAAGEKIDMFLMEADYALKYVNSDYTLPLRKWA